MLELEKLKNADKVVGTRRLLRAIVRKFRRIWRRIVKFRPIKVIFR